MTRRSLLFGGGAGFVGAYDAIPNLAHVYEPARRTLSAYTGPLVRLRRSSDNAESDFGYVEATGELDTAAIAAWLGAGSGYGVTVYDQKGTDNITQATAARQPLYSATAQNGHAGFVYDGSASYAQNDYLRGVFTNDGTIAQPLSVYVIGQLDAAVVDDGVRRRLFFGTDEIAETPAFMKESTLTPDAWRMAAGANIDNADADADWNLWAGIFNGASSYFYINNALIGGGNAGTGALTGAMLGDGVAVWSGNGWRGPIVSCVVVSAAHDNAQRAAMQTAMNSYWSVYPF